MKTQKFDWNSKDPIPGEMDAGKGGLIGWINKHPIDTVLIVALVIELWWWGGDLILQWLNRR